MTNFSTRYGYKKNTIQIKSVSDEIRRKVYNVYYRNEAISKYVMRVDGLPIRERILYDFGILFEDPDSILGPDNNERILKKFLITDSEWFVVYDFIEKYLEHCEKNKVVNLEKEFNRILEDESAGYRVLEKQIVPITTESELAAIHQAATTKYESVNNHMSKALNLYADRKKPDYENSVKESISAVEAMCCIITGMTGANATLGAALKKLKDNGVHIHKAMENAFSSLYGYASNENGIRHGGIDFTNVPAEDAKYMLVSCSAFVNYLIEKWSKVSRF